MEIRGIRCALPRSPKQRKGVVSLQNHPIQSNRRVAFIGDGRRDSLVGGQSDLSCALHIYLGLGPRSLGTIHDPLGDDEAPSGSMVCGIDLTLPANGTAATAEVMPSVLDEMHFIGCRKAASLAGRAKLKPEPQPGPEPKPNVEP